MVVVWSSQWAYVYHFLRINPDTVNLRYWLSFSPAAISFLLKLENVWLCPADVPNPPNASCNFWHSWINCSAISIFHFGAKTDYSMISCGDCWTQRELSKKAQPIDNSRCMGWCIPLQTRWCPLWTRKVGRVQVEGGLLGVRGRVCQAQTVSAGGTLQPIGYPTRWETPWGGAWPTRLR